MSLETFPYDCVKPLIGIYYDGVVPWHMLTNSQREKWHKETEQAFRDAMGTLKENMNNVRLSYLFD